jgi:serine phosphatase RsbU (regulator of sigma subunit)
MVQRLSTRGRCRRRLKVLSNSHGLSDTDARQVFKGKQYQLERGDKAFAYTDGLTENILDPARGPLRQEKLTEILIHSKSPMDIQKELGRFIQGNHGRDMDDTAFIAVQWKHFERAEKITV